MFCLPGDSFTSSFLQCWTDTIKWCQNNDIEWELKQGVSSNVYYVRGLCLQLDYKKGKKQQPFHGAAYDYIMFIDSDQTWTVDNIADLIIHDESIVSGYYLCEGGKQTVVGEFDITNYKNTFLYTSWELKKLPRNSKGLTEVGYTGFGFMLIKKGVIESMEYPYFEPIFTENDSVRDFSGEDVGFCYKAKQAGFKILVDTFVKVGHEKKQII